MKKILLLGSQHGDEPLGDLLYEYIGKHHPERAPEIDFIIGNPQAKRKNVRFIESDLNRSYSGKGETYEERRAIELVRIIAKHHYSLVLDLHTTTCMQPPCLITASVDHPFIRYTSIGLVVYMNDKIVNSSLIGVCDEAISIEVNKTEINDAMLESLYMDILCFVNGAQPTTAKKVFEVIGLLRKSELSQADVERLRNFERSPQGFYPVLVGENSYKKHTEYLGFKTQLIAE